MRRLFRQLDVPLPNQDAEDAKGAPPAEPVLGDLLEVLDAVYYIPPRRLLRQVQQVNRAGGM